MSFATFIPKDIMVFNGIAERIKKFYFPVFDASIYILNLNIVCCDQFVY